MNFKKEFNDIFNNISLITICILTIIILITLFEPYNDYLIYLTFSLIISLGIINKFINL